MSSAAILLIVVSFIVLVLSFLTWRQISSRAVIFIGLLGSGALLFAAYFAAKHDARNLPLTYSVPFVVAMAFTGRAIGLVLRVKKEPELKMPALYLFASGAAAIAGAVSAWLVAR